MYRALATTRYTKDLDKFEEETKKYDSLKSVYANIENNNYDPHTAAMMILSAQDSNFKNYDKELQDKMAKNVAAGFEKVYEGEGDDKKEVGFKVYHDELNIQAPQRGDYFKSPDFWAKLSDEIRSGTVGPLQEQIIKLFGNKKIKAEVNLGDNEAIKGTEIKNFIKENDVNKKAFYTSKNVGGVDAVTGSLVPAIEDGDELWDYYEKTTLPEIKKIIGIEGASAQSAIINPLISMDASIQENYTMDVENNELVISGDGHFAATQLNNIWQSVWNKEHNSIFFKNYPNAEGKLLTGDVTRHDLSVGGAIYRDLVNTRLLQLSNETIKPFDSETASIAGFYWIPESIIDFPTWTKIGKMEGGREWQEAMVLKMTAAANVAIDGQPGSLSTNEIRINQALEKVWHEQLATWEKQKTKAEDEKLMPDSQIRGKAKLVTQEIIEATMKRNKGTWEEAVTFLQEIHDYTIPSGLETKPKIDSTSPKEPKIPQKKKPKKKIIIKKEDTKLESTGVGSQPWLYSDETFNPDFDASVITNKIKKRQYNTALGKHREKKILGFIGL